MNYTRSSFLKWLKEHCGCEINPVRDTFIIAIKNGPIIRNMWLTNEDSISYSDICSHCRKLGLTDLPGDKDLKRIQ